MLEEYCAGQKPLNPGTVHCSFSKSTRLVREEKRCHFSEQENVKVNSWSDVTWEKCILSSLSLPFVFVIVVSFPLLINRGKTYLLDQRSKLTFLSYSSNGEYDWVHQTKNTKILQMWSFIEISCKIMDMCKFEIRKSNRRDPFSVISSVKFGFFR